MNSSARAGLISVLIGVACCGGLAACGGGADAPASVPVAVSPVSQSNATIAALVYSDSQRTPPGFALEPVPSLGVAVQTWHLRNDDLAPGATAPHELCTDDSSQALQWSDDADALSGDNATVAGDGSTERYFEIDRLRPGTPQTYLRERVYRCAYLNRDDTNLALPEGAAGQLNERPLDAAGLQALSEYLWQFTSYNNYGNVVLQSSGSSSSGQLDHTLYIATLHRAASAASCDTIEVLAWKHTMNASTGMLELSVATLWSFGASDASGVASLCGG